MSDKLKILITGAAGSVGSTLVKGMKDRYSIRGLDRQPMAGIEDAIIGDVADLDLVRQVTKDMDAVVHLTGVDHEWEGVLQSNLIGTYNSLEKPWAIRIPVDMTLSLWEYESEILTAQGLKLSIHTISVMVMQCGYLSEPSYIQMSNTRWCLAYLIVTGRCMI